MARQELVEVSVLHVLRDHTERVAADAHSQQPNDVGVLQTRHDLYLFQEIAPAWSENVTQHSAKHVFGSHIFPALGTLHFCWRPTGASSQPLRPAGLQGHRIKTLYP